MTLGDRFPALARQWAVLVESWQQQTQRDLNARPRSDLDFLPAALEIMETPPSPGYRYLMLGLCALFALALGWSIVGRIDVVATASGKVVPSGNVKIIQPIAIGYVRAINVRNGQRVRAGQLLVELDPTIEDADAAQARQTLLTADAIAARNAALLAHLNSQPARFQPPPGMSATVAASQAEYVRRAIDEFDGEIASLTQQRAEQQAVLQGAEAEVAKLALTLPLVERQLESRKRLAAKGYFSNLRLLEYEQLRLEHIQNIAVQRANAAKARAAIANIGAQMARLRGSFGKAAATARAEAQGNANLSRADVARYTRRTAFNQLRAPVAGTVQQLSIATIGGIVQPAQPLMIIVPDGAAPVVEANVAGKDIGFIREGQAVRVKFEAFPFTTYGIVPGVVESISRDAIEVDRRTGGGPGPQSSLIYAARIRLLQSTIRVRGRDQPIGHGLAVQAEIKTGERRIIDYILSPVKRTLDEAGRER